MWFLGPIRIQQDFLILIATSIRSNSTSHLANKLQTNVKEDKNIIIIIIITISPDLVAHSINSRFNCTLLYLLTAPHWSMENS